MFFYEITSRFELLPIITGACESGNKEETAIVIITRVAVSYCFLAQLEVSNKWGECVLLVQQAAAYLYSGASRAGIDAPLDKFTYFEGDSGQLLSPVNIHTDRYT